MGPHNATGEDARRFWLQFGFALLVQLVAIIVTLVMTFAGVDKRLAVIESGMGAHVSREYVDGLFNGSAADRAGLHEEIDDLAKRIGQLEADEKKEFHR